MSELLKRVLHDCPLPTPTDQDVEHKWTCDGCGTEYLWVRTQTWKTREVNNFITLLTTFQVSRWVTHVRPGFWWCSVSKRERWEPAS